MHLELLLGQADSGLGLGFVLHYAYFTQPLT